MPASEASKAMSELFKRRPRTGASRLEYAEWHLRKAAVFMLIADDPNWIDVNEARQCAAESCRKAADYIISAMCEAETSGSEGSDR